MANLFDADYGPYPEYIFNQIRRHLKNNLLLWSAFGSGEHYSGPATYSYRVFSKLDRNRFRVSLAHGFENQQNSEVFDREELVYPYRKGLWDQAKFFAAARKWIRRNHASFDLFYGLSGFEHTVAAANEAKRFDKPVVLFVSIQGGGLAPKDGWKRYAGIYHRRLEKAKKFNAIIALSEEIQCELLYLGISEKCIVRIPNFADCEKYKPVKSASKTQLRRKLGMKDIPTIVFAGRLCERKRPLLIVEAIAELKRKGHEFQIVFVGPADDSDPYVQRINQVIVQEGLTEFVYFTGFTREVEVWLQAADVFCLPSQNEGMPASVVEALACGLPVVLTPFSSAAELLSKPWCGSVVSENPSAAEYADAIKSEMENFNSDDGNEMRHQFVVENYSLDAIARMHQSLFERLLSGGDAKE